jgi:hypothetical protein
LNDGDGASTTIGHPVVAGAAPQETEHGAHAASTHLRFQTSQPTVARERRSAVCHTPRSRCLCSP